MNEGPTGAGQPQHRIHLILDEDEMKAIDDFSFEARIRTRSAAIRKLIELGLEQHRSQDTESYAQKLVTAVIRRRFDVA